jgi:hypothetical protein
LEGPDLERNKVVRWRCVDLRAEIAACCQRKVEMSPILPK